MSGAKRATGLEQIILNRITILYPGVRITNKNLSNIHPPVFNILNTVTNGLHLNLTPQTMKSVFKEDEKDEESEEDDKEDEEGK